MSQEFDFEIEDVFADGRGAIVRTKSGQQITVSDTGENLDDFERDLRGVRGTAVFVDGEWVIKGTERDRYFNR